MQKSSSFAIENLVAIKAKFAEFQTKVCDKFELIGVNVMKFRHFVRTQFSPGDCIPQSPTTLAEIFESITLNGLWDYHHYSPLVQIIKRFGAGDAEMETWIQKYKNDLRSYKLVATLEHYIYCELDAHTEPPPANIAKYDPRYCCSVKWKTDFIEHSLQYLSDVWEMFSSHYLLPDSPPTALLDRVCNGCVLITWLIPTKLVPQLIKRAKTYTEFFQKHRILQVTVGNQCVYKQKMSEESSSVSLLSMHRNSPN